MRGIVLTTSAVAAAICLAVAGEPTGTFTDTRNEKTYEPVKTPGAETRTEQNPNYMTTTGTFTDIRDMQTYKTVTIGNQTWMAENLNYEMDSSWCYNNKESNCRKYGRLYSWNAARQACPAGYHLPHNLDWNDLKTAAGYNERNRNGAGKKLKSKSGWNWNGDDNASGNGTDDLGFSALPGGYRGLDGRFDDAGNRGV